MGNFKKGYGLKTINVIDPESHEELEIKVSYVVDGIEEDSDEMFSENQFNDDEVEIKEMRTEDDRELSGLVRDKAYDLLLEELEDDAYNESFDNPGLDDFV